MSKLSKFANLLKGTVAPLAAKAADGDDTDMEKPTKKDDESEEDFQKRLKEWEDAQDDGENAETPKDTSDDDQDDSETLKQCRAEGVAEGVAAEKARWSAVLSSKAAAGKPVAACTFLEETAMTAEAINKALAAMPAEAAANKSTLRARQSEEVIPVPAPGGAADAAAGGKSSAQTFADQVAAAVAKARPPKAA